MTNDVPKLPATIKCPGCGKQAIKQYTGRILESYPPQKEVYYRCLCGWKGDVAYERDLTEDERFERDWKALNRGKH